MRSQDITTGAACYYAPGRPWRVASPKKAVIVDPQPRRIVQRRAGAFYTVSHHPDPAGTAVLVDLHETTGVRRTAVYRRDLRGLWDETLAATGRTEAGMLAYAEAIRALATGPVTADAVLRLAAMDPGVDDDTFTVLARAVDGGDL